MPDTVACVVGRLNAEMLAIEGRCELVLIGEGFAESERHALREIRQAAQDFRKLIAQHFSPVAT